MRLVQHKKEAFWFYRYLSIFYDKLVNPLFWTLWMRKQSHELGKFDVPGIKVIDVGSGTGFNTQGVVEYVPAERVTCVDQSPHQMAKAKAKPQLQNCTFIVGDAENVPAETDSFDRYVSAGSIEYWPNPQQGINESYRVIKPGGLALMIGPMQPKSAFARFIANTWMLFPSDQEYKDYYKNAGFENIKYKYVKPHWYPDNDGYAIAIVGTKPRAGESPYPAPILETETREEAASFGRNVKMILRVLIGSTAGFIFIPIALLGYLFNSFRKQEDRPKEYEESLNGYQRFVLLLIFALFGAAAWSMFT